MNENKIKNTKVGDDIHFFVNGSEDRGIVVKMNNEYVTVFKESTQNYDDIHINDTFFIKDILINKEWDKMEDVERFELLKSIHAPTPRFLSKSWDQLPKEIKTLLVKNNGIETSHKKDEDPMDTTVRTFDKTLNQTSRGKPKQRTRGGVKTTVGGDKDAGIKEEPKGFSRSGEKQEGLTHNVANFDEFKTIEEEKLGEGSKGDKNVTGMNFMEEGGDKIGVGASLSGQDRATEQEIKFGKQQGRRDQGKKDDDVTAGVSALKAWQLWLAEREQQVLKDSLDGKGGSKPESDSHDLRTTDPESTLSNFQWHKSDVANRSNSKVLRTDEPERTADGKVKPNKNDSEWDQKHDNAVGIPESDSERVGMADTAANRPSDEYNTDRKVKAWEDWLDNQKSSVETSIHGNAARNPNSGVNTNTSFDAPKDYEGFSHDGIRLEQFKHEKKKPNVGKEKVNINIDGKEKPADSTNGGSKNNEYGTPTENPTDKKGRIISEKDKK